MNTHPSIKETLVCVENRKMVTAWLAKNKDKCRHQLARDLCEQLRLQDAVGGWRIAGTLKALRELEAEGYWRLPEVQNTKPRRWQPRRLNQPVPKATGIPQTVAEVKGLKLVEVNATDEMLMRTWNELIIREHPLQDARLVGRQLRYLIDSEYGWLGAIGFGSSALYLESRDRWLRWTAEQRREHHERVAAMTRFLIRPSVRCAGLASRVLGLCVRQVVGDFRRRYGFEPWLLESFVDRSKYKGTCYQAANWVCVGQTRGRGRNGSHTENKSIKDVYLYPVVDDVHRRMGRDPAHAFSALTLTDGLERKVWAQQEFGGCELGDPRRTRQLVKLANRKAERPGGSYAQACGGNRHELKGYYRLLNNEAEEIAPAGLLACHREQTLRRMKSETMVLAIQDTTDLNYATRRNCEGLGVIGKNQTSAKTMGLKLHSSLAVNLHGVPLGLLRLQAYAPEFGAERDPKRPIEEKTSYRWIESYVDLCTVAPQLPDTQLISVCDREGDMFELFEERRKRGGAVELLVRAKWDRRLEDSERTLFEQLRSEAASGTVSVPIPRQREQTRKGAEAGRTGLAARIARLEVRFGEVMLSVPSGSPNTGKEPVRLFAVHLVEPNPPTGAERIEWLLLTSVAVQSVKQAMQVVRWYCLRWRIEEWHRVLKSGCRIQARQHHSAKVIARSLVLDAVIAWRLMVLTLLGRETPGLPCDVVFNRWECVVLQVLSKKKSH